MKIASRKNKGRRLVKYIVSRILDTFPSLTKRDVRPVPSGTPGEDVQLSEAAKKKFPFSVEAKNQEALPLWDALKQCESGNRELTPLLVFKRNRSEVYCAMRFEDFMRILGEKSEPYRVDFVRTEDDNDKRS